MGLKMSARPDDNPFCMVLSEGRLPFGFCPSTNPGDKWGNGQNFDFHGATYRFWDLRNPKLSRLIPLIMILKFNRF
jgi:hypothetical protein